MSNREDYLDGLLRSVTTRGEDYASDLLESEDDFLEKFDQEVADLDETSFLNDFELDFSDIDLKEGLELPDHKPDLDGLDSVNMESDRTEFDDMDSFMVDTIKDESFEEGKRSKQEESNAGDSEDQIKDLDEMLAAAMNAEPAEDELHIDTMLTDDLDLLDKAEGQEFGEMSFDTMESDTSEDDKDILDLLSDMSEDDDLADIGSMLKAHENDEEINSDDIGLDELADKKDLNLENDGKAGKKKAKAKAKKSPKEKKDKDSSGSLLNRLSLLFFGEDDEDIEVPEHGELKNISQENMEVLKDLEKEKKKNAKKEKQELKKLEKQEKREQKEKAALEKKALKEEKKKDRPVEVDHSPPLPKVPVVLIFLMSISIILLVILVSNLTGYTLTISEAEAAMSQKNYIEAYEALSGAEIKKTDQKLYEKARLTALLQREEEGYVVYMEQKMYAEALDSLVSGINKYHTYAKEAKAAEATAEFKQMRKQFQKHLKDSFNINEKKALELFKTEDRVEYTKKINQIIDTVKLP